MTDPEPRPTDDAGVLSSLTGTRPQRRSAKRPATKPSRRAQPPTADPVAGDAPPPDPAPSEPPPAGTSRAEPPPPQGFEANPIVGSVDPPTATELLTSLAQGATELAEVGLAVGRRLAHALIDRLPRI
jgi:hypothetical protein